MELHGVPNDCQYGQESQAIILTPEISDRESQSDHLGHFHSDMRMFTRLVLY